MIDILNTYRLYRTQITNVCQWLTRASSASVETPPSLPQTETARSKGKARRSRKGNKAKPANTPSIRRITIPSYKLVEMAQVISNDPLKFSTLPPSIVNELEHCILLHENFLAIYQIKSDDGKLEIKNPSLKNRQHAYFIRILRVVLTLLKPDPSNDGDAKPTPKDEPENASKPSDALRDLTNFSSLNLTEQEKNDDEPVQTTFTVPMNPPVENSGDLKDSATQDQAVLGELFFATFCLFTDLNRYKSLVLQHWELYKTLQVSLELVTLITNTAIAAMRNSEQQFVKDFEHILPDSPGYRDLAAEFYADIVLQRGVVIEGPGHRAEISDIRDLMCTNAAHLLDTILPMLKTKLCPAVTWLVNPYDPTIDRSKISIDQARSQDDYFFFSLITPLAVLNKRKTAVTVRDEFTIGMNDLHRVDQGPVGVWLAFAVTIVIEANSILGVDASRGFEELQSAARTAQSTLALFDAASLKELPPDKRAIHVKQAKALTWMINWTILEDHYTNGKDDTTAELAQPFYLYKNHPLLCGTALLWLRLKMHEMGRFYGGIENCFIYAAHAYHTFRKLGRLEVKWPEMESFISYHTPEKIFGGRKPRDLEECLKSLHLVNGMSIGMVPGTSNLHWKAIDGPTIEPLKKSSIIEFLMEWATSDHETGHKVMDKLLDQFMESQNNKASPKQSQTPDLVTRILAVKGLLENEISYLRSDLCRLYLTSMDIFRKIKSKLDPYFESECEWILAVSEKHVEPPGIIAIILRYRTIEKHMDRAVFQRERPCFSSHCIVVGSRLMKERLQQ